jgi:flagellar biosynthetic protein FliR
VDPRLFEGHAVALLLHLARTGAFLAVVPLFGRQRDSFFLRLVLSVALGTVFWWSDGRPAPVPHGVAAFGLLVAQECLVGFALGFALSLLTSLLVAAGEIVSTEMGFSMSRIMNPETGVDATVVSQLFQVFGFLLILQFDIHHEALRILDQTFAACPIGEPLRLEPVWEGIRTLVGASILFALQYAFPVLAIMLLLTVGLVLFGRAVPHVNLMEFGFTARVLVALMAAAWFLSAGTPFLLRAFGSILDGARAMFPV